MTVKIKRNDIQQAEQTGSIVEKITEEEHDYDDWDTALSRTSLGVGAPDYNRMAIEVEKYNDIYIWLENDTDKEFPIIRFSISFKETEIKESGGTSGYGVNLDLSLSLPAGSRMRTPLSGIFEENAVEFNLAQCGFKFFGIQLRDLDEPLEGKVRWAYFGVI